MNVKKALDWPVKRPIAVRNLRAPVAVAFVGRTTEQAGRLASMNGQGSGMIRLVWNISLTAAPVAPLLGSTPQLRSGKFRPLVGSVSGGAEPAAFDQVWKCISSIGPMLMRRRSTSTLVARCAIARRKLPPPCSTVGIWNAAVLAIA